MAFKDYYEALPRKEAPRVRDQIMSSCGWAYVSSFYYKMQRDSFTKLEREKISVVVGLPEAMLFPNPVSEEVEA
jgi:radical SAM superfamily enzyme YgiQ (UPF0313 family)